MFKMIRRFATIFASEIVVYPIIAPVMIFLRRVFAFGTMPWFAVALAD
jgi:hypothetical protein